MHLTEFHGGFGPPESDPQRSDFGSPITKLDVFGQIWSLETQIGPYWSILPHCMVLKGP